MSPDETLAPDLDRADANVVLAHDRVKRIDAELQARAAGRGEPAWACFSDEELRSLAIRLGEPAIESAKAVLDRAING